MPSSLDLKVFELGIRITQANIAYVIPQGRYESEWEDECQITCFRKLEHIVVSLKESSQKVGDVDELVSEIKRIIGVHIRNHAESNVSNRNISFQNLLHSIDLCFHRLLLDTNLSNWYSFGLAISNSWGTWPSRIHTISLTQRIDSKGNVIFNDIPFGRDQKAEWTFEKSDQVRRLSDELNYKPTLDYCTRFNEITDEQWGAFPGLPQGLWGWLCLEKDLNALKREAVSLSFTYEGTNCAIVTHNGRMHSVDVEVARCLETIFKANGQYITQKAICMANSYPPEVRIKRILVKLPIDLRNLIKSDKRGYYFINI